MAALTAPRLTRTRNPGAKRSHPAAVGTIWAGSLVMINAAGYLIAAAAEAGNAGCVGIATETVVNSGAAGSVRCEYQECDALLGATSIVVGNNGEIMYASDDQTVDETQGANQPIAGVLVEFVSATSGWVAVGIAVGR